MNVKNLSARYLKADVISGVNLKVGAREIVSILGANGAGKTTILRAISGVKVKRGGEISFEEKPIQSLSASEILKLGIAHVPEGRGIFPKMTVGENLKLGAYVRKDKQSIKQDEERILKIFPILETRYKQLAGTLSGGEQQMVVLGRALMSNPKILMLDEPSLGLAPKVVESLAEIICQLRHDGVSVVLVEQNSEMALEISDRAYILENGRVTLEGTAKELIGNSYVQEAYLGG